MKIVHVVYSLEMGGAEVLVGQLCRLQRAQGHAVSVFAYSNLGPVGEVLRAEGFEIYVPGEGPVWRTMRSYWERLRAMRPDVVHCHNEAPTLQAAMAARLAGVPRVVTTRHSLVAPPYRTAEEVKFSLAALFCDWVVGICEITCVNLRGAPLARRKKIVRVYNGATGVERTGFEALGKRGFTVVFVGRLAPVKDLGTLIRGAVEAARRVEGLALWIVGDGNSRGELEALVDELGARGVVRFWGERLDTAGFFSAADVFAMSSMSEGLPMSLLQAMSAGVPAVVTDVGGMAEVTKLAGCGERVPVGDWSAMGNALVRLAESAELRAELGARGRVTFEAEFTLERMAEGYERLYGTTPKGGVRARNAELERWSEKA